jgi:hypothetical protein
MDERVPYHAQARRTLGLGPGPRRTLARRTSTAPRQRALTDLAAGELVLHEAVRTNRPPTPVIERGVIYVH